MREFGDLGKRRARRLPAAAAAAALLPLAGIAFAAGGKPAPDPCFAGRAPVATAEAVGARDGMTVRLRDGGELRLAGILAPTRFDADAAAAERATAALDALVAGRQLVLHAAKQERDRHGRHLAQADAGEWVQAALVRAGIARVMPGAGEPDCAAPLLALERQARAADRGFWGESVFAVADAAAIPGELVAGGRFALVEATVRRVGEAGGRLFLDSGPRHWEDFTIVIPREAHAAFAAAGMDLRGLSGRRVRARGVLFSWGGPAMEVRVPAALELIGADEG